MFLINKYLNKNNMIIEYEYCREQIVENILCDGKKTNDGFYWYPNFSYENLLEGNCKDYEFYYPREMFKFKLYFSKSEIEAYLAKNKINNFDIDFMFRKSIQFYDNNKNLIEYKNINKKLPNVEFTLNELIDCFEYLNNH